MAEKIMSVILAAKESKEMKSAHPTAMVPVCGKCMVDYVLAAAKGAGSETNVMMSAQKPADTPKMDRDSSDEHD